MSGKFHERYVSYQSENRGLIESLRFCLLKMGILPQMSVESVNSGFYIFYPNKKNIYKITIPLTEEICILLDKEYEEIQLDYYTYENNIISKIDALEDSTYKGTLYDLQMANEHNYLLHNGLLHNGGGKRNGSIAMYLEPWHADIFDYLYLRKNHGNEEERARDLFYGLWIPDLFMERVQSNGNWTLMCPDECPGLSDSYGDEFKELYEGYERDGKGRETIPAQKLWKQILESQIESGTPYMLYKDACNKKSNQKNLGTIKSSNLCCEIIEYSSPDEAAVCNLASIGLPKFVKDGKFDYDKLGDITKIVTRNLNEVINRNFYPIPETRNSNMRHRPIGIGVQGLADVFAKMKISFDSAEAREVNRRIFEQIYYSALECSMDLSRKREKLIKKYKELLSKLSNMTEDNEEKKTMLMDKEKMEKELIPIKKN